MTPAGAPPLRFLRNIVADSRPVGASPPLDGEEPAAPGSIPAFPGVPDVGRRLAADLPAAPVTGHEPVAGPVVTDAIPQPEPAAFVQPSGDASDPPARAAPLVNVEDNAGSPDRPAEEKSEPERTRDRPESAIHGGAPVPVRSAATPDAGTLPAAPVAARGLAAPVGTGAHHREPASAARTRRAAQPGTGEHAEGATDTPIIPEHILAAGSDGSAAETEGVSAPAAALRPSPQPPDQSVPEAWRPPPVEAVAAATPAVLPPSSPRRPGAAPRTSAAEPTVQIGHIDVTVIAETPRSPKPGRRSAPERSVASLHYLRRF